MALLAEEVPEHDRIAAIREVGHADLRRALGQRFVRLARRVAGTRETGDVALHVLDHDRHSGGGKALGEDLNRHRLAGAGGAGDETMAIAVAQEELPRLGVVLAAAAHQNPVLGHHRSWKIVGFQIEY